MNPMQLTPEEIRRHLAAGETVWLCETTTAKHQVFSVEGLTADHAHAGEDFRIVIRGMRTGRMLDLHAGRDKTFTVEIPNGTSPKEG
ncbi:hypothetical protein [Nonomuraea sp. NPDC050786]|uniref:hypothetical protein n=1 Tax=Nonomuraea sp. NPDC050786 TaxID=3154840 RepID=UPI0033F3D28D